MSDAEHLIENALFAYHRGLKKGMENPFDNVRKSGIVQEQCKLCNVSIDIIFEFVDYIYWTLLDGVDRDEVFLTKQSSDKETVQDVINEMRGLGKHEILIGSEFASVWADRLEKALGKGCK